VLAGEIARRLRRRGDGESRERCERQRGSKARKERGEARPESHSNLPEGGVYVL
jgi:hypothetical protein